MEYKNIGGNTIKISLTFQDLEEHDVKMSDFFENQDIIEQLFYELVEELGLEENFGSTGMLTFQVQPNPRGVTLFVREENFDFNNGEPDFQKLGDMSDPQAIGDAMEDFFSRLSEAGQKQGLPALPTDQIDMNRMMDKLQQGVKNVEEAEKKEEEADFVFYAIKFENASELIAAAKNVRMDEEESELYRYQDQFYLVIMDNQKAKGRMTIENNRARMMEYGYDTTNGRDTLLEYGETLIKTRALSLLSKI